MSKPAALITGGGSGIGQAMAEHLVKNRGWKVTIADVNEETGKAVANALGPDASFIKTDVSKYDQQVAMFKHAFAFGGNRLDFFNANAAITDTEDIYADASLDANGDPKPLDLLATDVDLIAVIQGAWLYKHYAGKNPTPGGKLVMMSSSGGLYSSEMKPQYVLAKHAIVGLARSLSRPFFANNNITVNTMCPNVIITPLCPPHIASLFPAHRVTPMSTAIKALDNIIDSDITGKVLELITTDVLQREEVPYGNDAVKWCATEGNELFKKGYGNPVKEAAGK